MGLKYAFFHWSVHLLFVVFIYFIFNLNWFNSFFVLVSAGIIDLDHLPSLKSRGLVKWVKSRMNFHTPKKYFFHNFFVLLFCVAASLLVFYPSVFILGICFFSVALHLLWDFAEDFLIFKMDSKHWKI